MKYPRSKLLSVGLGLILTSVITHGVEPADTREEAREKANNASDQYVFVSEEEYGEAWPYKFAFGLLTCLGYHDVVIITGGKTYAVNGKATGAQTRHGKKLYEDDWNVRKPFYETGRMPPPSGFIKKGLALCK